MLPWKKILKGFKWVGITLGALFAILVIVRIPHVLEVQKTAEQVAVIHATKLTLADVMGENLPPDPGAEADKTVAGIDANTNGIRDDVELAIFKEYPDSARVRAALLQYALAMQIEMTLPFLNKEIVTASIEDNESRADVCLWGLSSRLDIDKFIADMNKYRAFVEGLQVNTAERRLYIQNFYSYMGSYSSSNDGCDIDVSKLKN